MTSAFRGPDAAIVAFLSAVVAQATGNPERPALPSLGAHVIGDLTTRGLILTLRRSTTDSGRNPK